jgi:hypothetical protein
MHASSLSGFRTHFLSALLGALIATPLVAQSPVADATSPVTVASSTLLLTEDGVPTRQARQSPTFLLYWENDYFGGTDRHYTNGGKIAWLTADLSDWGREDGWRRSVLNALPFINRQGTQKNLGVALGQKMFTPRDISAPNPDPEDRPYAGWTYVEFSFLAKTSTRADTIAVQLGMVGPHSYAGDLQTWIHELIDGEVPQGWDYQLQDEFGVNVAWERKWRIYARTLSRADGMRPLGLRALQDRTYWGFDVVPHLGAVAGNIHTYANAGLTGRLGYNLPSDFGVNLMRPAGLTSAPIDDLDPRVRGSGWSVFVFGGVDARAVARNIFLDGNTFADSRSVERKPYVTDFSYGFGIVRNTLQLTFTRVVRTREFTTQPGSNSDFGSLTASWTF